MLKRKRKRIKAIQNRPKVSEFSKSRYMERDGIIWMRDSTNEVYPILDGFWNDAKRELRRLRTMEWKQNN